MRDGPNLLRDAAAEIRALRRHNEILAAKVEMIDLFACVLHTAPAQRNEGAGIDIAWELDRAADEAETEAQPEPEGLRAYQEDRAQ